MIGSFEMPFSTLAGAQGLQVFASASGAWLCSTARPAGIFTSIKHIENISLYTNIYGY
jgi:hypothetical protein